jgi:hypothetical protein
MNASEEESQDVKPGDKRHTFPQCVLASQESPCFGTEWMKNCSFRARWLCGSVG